VFLGLEYSVYILFSKTFDLFYVGQTQDINECLLLHLENNIMIHFTVDQMIGNSVFDFEKDKNTTL